MENRVSDFKIAEAILRYICKKHDVNFVDVPIMVEGDSVSGALDVRGSKNVAHTIYKIVSEYIENSNLIVGVPLIPCPHKRQNFLTTFAAKLRSFIYKDNRFYSPTDHSHLFRLYQRTLVWILMKDLICPLYDKDLRNIKIVCGENPYLDIARYYKEGEFLQGDQPNYEFVFINNVDNIVVQNALLFLETLRAFDLSPLEVMKDIYDSDIYDKYRGLLELALEDEDADDFEATILVALGINLRGLLPPSCIAKEAKVKIAQHLNPAISTNWWQLGVLEKMIEPHRGSDWSVYKELEPYVQEFWNKVEETKKKRAKKGHDPEIPFDLLLRLKVPQTVEYKADPTKTIQSLLSSDRVW